MTAQLFRPRFHQSPFRESAANGQRCHLWQRRREKAMKFKFAAFKINSIDMKITSRLRRVSTPATPIIKRIAATTRNFEMSGCLTPSKALDQRSLEASWKSIANNGVR